MTGEKLHKYDLDLCEYALGNIRQYLHENPFARATLNSLGTVFFNHLCDARNPDAERKYLLVNDREFQDLVTASLEGWHEWVAYEPLHQRHVECVKEIQKELTKQDAEDWSRACARFADQLEAERLSLDEGMFILYDWVRYLRRLLRAMEATDLLPYPVGRMPTPTCPHLPTSTPNTTVTPAKEPFDQEAQALKRMRELIQEHGVGAAAKNLVLKSGIRQKHARDALRALESLGEFKGFSRKRPRRYRPSDRT